MKIKLSKKVMKALMRLGDRFFIHRTPERIVEGLILDRYHSSDARLNQIRRDKRYLEFSEQHLDEDLTNRQIFVKAYNMGWVDLQIRHDKDLLPVLDGPEEKEHGKK